MILQKWRISLFNGITASDGNRTIRKFRTEKTAELLAFLAYNLDRAVNREDIADAIWPSDDLDASRASLRTAIHSLRRQLEPPGTPENSVIVSGRASIAVPSDAVTTYVSEFCESYENYLQSNPDERLAIAKAALSLYQGELLPGCYSDWATKARDLMKARQIELLKYIALQTFTVGNFDEALRFAAMLKTADPLSESSHTLEMQILASAERYSEALRVFNAWRLVTEQELNMAPSKPAVALALQIAEFAKRSMQDLKVPVSRLPEAVPVETVAEIDALLSTTNTPDSALPNKALSGELPDQRVPSIVKGLPLDLTRFFGREAEMAHLMHLLDVNLLPDTAHGYEAHGCRLITITGPAGCGKTRLASQAARKIAQTGESTVVFVSLSEIADPRRILENIASRMEINAPEQSDLERTIARQLGDCPALIVLDNFEQLLPPYDPADSMAATPGEQPTQVGPAEAAVMSLLEACPRASLLITSRQCLGIEGEMDFSIDSLAVPDPLSPLGELLGYPAIQLFVDRSQLVLPDFQITSRNCHAVASLCARLEGLPLALELAATWCKVLTPMQILDRAHGQLGQLTSRRRGRASRHQTLHAAVLWSYELLSPELQSFLRRLSVFRGSWSAEAATEVCLHRNRMCASHSDEVSFTLELLHALTDRSLVMTRTVTDGAQDEVRYYLLETIREFADSKLSENERQEVLQRHHTYFCKYAVNELKNLAGANQAQWLRRIGQDHENLYMALESCLSELTAENVKVGLTILGCLNHYFCMRGNYTHLRRTLDILLNAPAGVDASESRARALNMAGALATYQMDLQAAKAYYSEMLGISENRYPLLAASAFICLGAGALQVDNEASVAREYYNKALTAYTEAGSALGVAAVYGSIAELDAHIGDKLSAIQHLTRAVEIQRAHNNLSGVTHFLRLLANVYSSSGRVDEALNCLRESLEGYIQLNDIRGLAELYVTIAGALPHLEEAIQLLGMADTINKNVDATDSEITRVAERSRAILGIERFEAARAYGQSLNKAEAHSIARRITSSEI